MHLTGGKQVHRVLGRVGCRSHDAMRSSVRLRRLYTLQNQLIESTCYSNSQAWGSQGLAGQRCVSR